MITRRQLLATSALALSSLASPRLALAQAVEMKRVKIGSILAGTTVAAELLPALLKQVGVEAEIVNFPNITQRMQAVASGDVQIGYGGVSAAISMAGRGFPLLVLSNACDGGYGIVAQPSVGSLADLKGKKLAVQFGSMQFAIMQWKLKQLGLLKDVELLNLNNAEMATALQRRDVDAIYAIEPYPTFAVTNGWGRRVDDPYNTPAGRVNLAFVASRDFVGRYPVLSRVVTRAHVEATRSLAADPSLAVSTLVKTLNVSEPVAKDAMKNIHFSDDSGEAFRKGVIASGDLMVQAGLIEKLPAWDAFFHTPKA